MFIALFPPIFAVVFLGFAAHVSLKLRPAFAPFVSACGIILFLVLSGSINLLLPGSILLYTLCAAVGVWGLVRRRKAFFTYLVSPGVLAFLIGALVLAWVYTQQQPFYYMWDDLAHWGPFYKNTKLYGALHQFTPQSMVHQAYAQGTVVFYYFYSLFSPAFSEAHTFASLGLLLSACSATLLARASWKQPVRALLLVLMAPLFYVLFPYSSAYITVSLDTLMGAVFGAVLLLVLHTRRFSWRRTITLVVAGGALTQIKDIGFLLTLVCVVLYSLALLLAQGEEKTLRQTLRANATKQWIRHSLFSLGALLPAVYWKIFLLLTKTAQDQFSAPLGGGFLSRVAAAMRGENEVVPVIWEQFRINFLHKPVVYNGFGTPAIVSLLLTLGGLVLGVWLWRKKQQRGAAAILWAMPVFFAAYLFAIFYTYVSMMTPQEGMMNASYERYIASFFIAWIMLLLGVCLHLADDFVPALPGVLPLAASSAVLALLLNFCLQHDFLNLNYTRQEAGRVGFDDVSAQMLRSMQPGDDVWVITQGSDVLYTFMYHFTLLPARVSLSLPHSIGLPDTVTQDLTPEDFLLLAREQGIEYILVYIIDEQFDLRYQHLFSDNLASVRYFNLPSLYTVRPDGTQGAFTLHLATTQPLLPDPPVAEEAEVPS